MNRKDTGVYIGKSDNTLRQWSYLWSKGEPHGPRPFKVGGRVFYLKSDCDAYIAAGKP